MIEIIAVKLVETLAGHLFQKYLNSLESINIEGAPSWYGKEPNDDDIHVYVYKDGTVDAIDKAKSDAKYAMVRKIDGIIDVVIYENFKSLNDPKEKQLVEQFKHDQELEKFVHSHLIYHKIEAFEERSEALLQHARPARTFIEARLSKKTLLEYEKMRIQKIKTSLTTHRSNNAFSELEENK